VRVTGDTRVCPPGTWNVRFYAQEAPDRQVTPRHVECLPGTASALDYDFGTGAPRFSPPDPSFPPNHFSVLAECVCVFSPGRYTLVLDADTFAEPLIDGIGSATARAVSRTTITLSGGVHRIAVSYYEQTGSAHLRLSWAPATTEPVTINAPMEGQVLASGSDFAFSGRAVDGAGNPLPEDALRWGFIPMTCKTPTRCDAHPYAEATGSGGAMSPVPGRTGGPNGTVDRFLAVFTAYDPATNVAVQDVVGTTVS
jgi:hypothetical protein